MYTAEDLRHQSAKPEVLQVSSASVTLYAGKVTVAERSVSYPGEEAQKARQALQESMDLREQGHADD